MARHGKRHGWVAPGPVDLLGRINRAESEGRYQQALELAKALYKHDASAENQEVVKRVTLGRIAQLRAQGHTRDAATALEDALRLDAQPAWREKLASELAAVGEVRRALALLATLPDSPALPRIWAWAADWSLSKGKSDSTLLPAELLVEHDIIHKAFADVEAGRDEDAKTSLQAIGLRSPFLDWKMLLRGLLAFHEGDEARALENWARLDPQRLPARLAAPLRYRADPAFRLAQPAATQAALQRQLDRLGSSGLTGPLRELNAALANERRLPQAFRLAENLLPALANEGPQLVARLARCFYWAIIQHGSPDDVPRFDRVFGKPPDDPEFSRLAALGFEIRGQADDAHAEWEAYEQEIAAGIVAWPGAHVARVRALIWNRMGHNAARALEPHVPSLLEEFGGRHAKRSWNPSAAQCFEKSLKLVPDQRDAYWELFNIQRVKKKPAEALKVGRRLLKRFPDDVPALEAVADLCMDRKGYDEALELLQHAVRNNPLERRLRDRVAFTRLSAARHHADKGSFDQARAHFRAVEAVDDSKPDVAVLCKRAAVEFKAGDTAQAEALLQRAQTTGNRLGIAFTMLIETIRFKLGKPLRNRFEAEVKAAVVEPPIAAVAIEVASIALSHRAAEVSYTGQKTHEKKVAGYLERALALDLAEEPMEQVAYALIELNPSKAALLCLARAQKRFSANPMFVLLEARYHMSKRFQSSSMRRVATLLEKADKLVSALPEGEKKNRYRELLQESGEMLPMMGSMAEQLREMAEEFGDFLDDDGFEF